ncbi:MAG: hypothetical protein HKP52_05375 [Desulfofustis sp.]|nr:hypothetical protein [Desulfofustis sp.]
MNLQLACFVSPHGFGHATRTIALLQALQKRIPGFKATIFTTVPLSLFQSSGIDYSYHPMITDVGVVQRDAFTEDREQTRAKLAEHLHYAPSLINQGAELCRSCQLIVCDISFLGIEVGKVAKIPTLLVENFTWDWIYSQMGRDTGFEPYIEWLSESYAKADFRIQTDPVCTRISCDLHCSPMARRGITPPDRIRAEVADGQRKIVLISMGGVALEMPFFDDLAKHEEYLFLVAGQNSDGLIKNNIRLIGPRSALHHPDLINAADLLICKSGYSTIAECQQTATPICCVAREHFAESKVVEGYVSEEMNGTVIDENYFFSGNWLSDLGKMTSRKRGPLPANGADQAAEFILSIL